MGVFVGIGVDVVDGVGVTVGVGLGLGIGVGVEVGVGLGDGVGVGIDVPKYCDIVITCNCFASDLFLRKLLIVLKSDVLYSSGALVPALQQTSDIKWNVITVSYTHL